MFIYDLSEWIANYPTQLCIIPALIGAGAAIVGGLLKSGGASKQQQRDQAFQREMWQKQVEQQDKVNAQQMAYQDKVNAENREWSTEKNVRQRVEDAGYNPYLYNGQASASSTGMASSTNLGNSVAAPTSNTSQNVMEGIGDMVGSVGSIMAQGVDTAQKAYSLKRGKDIDAQNDAAAGKVGGTESAQAQATLDASRNEARVKAATATAQEIQNGLSLMQAYDENGQPMTDEVSGRPLTMAQAKARGEQKLLYKNIDKLCQDIINGKLTEKNLQWDALIKEYNLTYLMPEQKEFLHNQIQNLIVENEKIKAETRVLGSQLELNKSTTRLNNQNVQTQRRYAELLGQQTLTEAQKTKLSEFEYYFGGADRLAAIMQRQRPQNLQQFLLHKGDYIWSKIAKKLGFEYNSDAEFVEKMKHYSDDAIAEALDAYLQRR